MSAATIVNGNYRADVRGGVFVGTHKVEIEAYGKAPSQPNPMWAPLNSLPKRYSVDSQLQLTIEPNSRDVVKDFDLRD
jgi:hypothetical protein